MAVTDNKNDAQSTSMPIRGLPDTGIGQGPFLPTLLHDLRNLLAPINNSLYVLRLRSDADPGLLPTLDTMDKQVLALRRAIDQLTAVDQLLRHDPLLASEAFPLTDVINSAIACVQPIFEQRGQRLHVTPFAEATVWRGSASGMTEVVTVLLENAAQCSLDGGEIWLEAAASIDEARISVRDSGVGISPDLLGKIFELTLAPGISVLSEQQGLQLRLVAAKNLVERHEGRLHAVSAGSGKGSEFVIYLPLECARTTRTDPRTRLRRAIPLTGIATPRASLTHLRMLIVDDSPAVQISLGAIVLELGHDVRAAVDGAGALTIARLAAPGGVTGYSPAHLQRLRRGATAAGSVCVGPDDFDHDGGRRAERRHRARRIRRGVRPLRG